MIERHVPRGSQPAYHIIIRTTLSGKNIFFSATRCDKWSTVNSLHSARRRPEGRSVSHPLPQGDEEGMTHLPHDKDVPDAQHCVDRNAGQA